MDKSQNGLAQANYVILVSFAKHEKGQNSRILDAFDDSTAYLIQIVDCCTNNVKRVKKIGSKTYFIMRYIVFFLHFFCMRISPKRILGGLQGLMRTFLGIGKR